MKNVPNALVVFTIALVCALSNLASAKKFELGAQAVHEIFTIAHKISKVQPFLSENKYLQYAHGIYNASREFEIDADLLIAIVQKESSFREGLPEGAAGERGICQIRKNWIENDQFRSYFKDASVERLENPKFAFRYAAWILKDLKLTAPMGELPFWTYYNSRAKTHRLNYFVAIHKRILAMQKQQQPVVQAKAQGPQQNEKPSLPKVGKKMAAFWSIRGGR